MKIIQLPLFLRRKFEKAIQRQTLEPVAPSAEKNVMQTLPAYMANLQASGYSESTTEKYFSDITRFSIFTRDKKIGEISTHDIQQWIGGLLSKNGEQLDPKTVNRKVSAIINYFQWLSGLHAITRDPTIGLSNERVQSPLPDYLHEAEIKYLFREASLDPRIYLLVFLFLETGM